MLNKLRDEIHQNAKDHGWWENERTFGEIIALCHSELSEALEEFRNGEPEEYYVCPDCGTRYGKYCLDNTGECACGYSGKTKPEGIAIELADCIIRILDYCGKARIDIEEAIRIKHEHNKSRPYRHGGKTI